MSKGSWRRPKSNSVSENHVASEWDRIFGKNRQHQANPEGAESEKEIRKASQVREADTSQKL